MNPGFWALTLVVVGAAAATPSLVLASRLRRARAEITRIRRHSQERLDSIAVFSHEIRTPLALITGPVEMLLEGTPGPLTAQQRRFLSTIRSNAQHLQKMGEDVLTQSRIEAGMFTMRPERVDLRTLGARVVGELRALHDLPIALDCPGAPPTVHGDPRLLLQALTNLLTNACRNSRGNTVTLRIQQQTATVLISVDDRGIGMNRQRRARVFEPYHTGSPEIGVGLGMMITREIVRMHGGRLHIQSTPNAGTTMMFALPILTTEEP